MSERSGLEIFLMGGNLAAGGVIGWLARSLMGDRKNAKPAITVVPVSEVLEQITATTTNCNRELETFRKRLSSLEQKVSKELLSEMQSFGQNYAHELGNNVCHLSDAVMKGEVELQQLLNGMVKQSESAEKYNATLEKSLEGHIQEDIQGLLRLAVSELMENNGELESELKETRRELDQQRNSLASARHDARIDPLTKISNRRSFEEKHEAAHSRFLHDGEPYALAIFDLDHFKELNDAYTHSAGDATLQVFARILRECIRAYDTATRYGGDEFVILLANADTKTANLITERARRRAARTNRPVSCP